MKTNNRLLALALSGAAILTVSALALTQPANPGAADAEIKTRNGIPDRSDDGKASDPDASALRRDLDRAASNIRSRAGMASCLEISEEGDHSIEEAYASGWIVDVSLEEVEAALAAAARTSDPQDDIVAKRLAHRGSYRYFYQK